ncbi:hypothetical protein V6N11_018177 [Hibiscus sabdariffa]|uniref:Uncharacterized protein n=1 Tax=Hibiscus sabdariffa TaxID=183260 RepID=A0ABR2T747_9ROSI
MTKSRVEVVVSSTKQRSQSLELKPRCGREMGFTNLLVALQGGAPVGTMSERWGHIQWTMVVKTKAAEHATTVDEMELATKEEGEKLSTLSLTLPQSDLGVLSTECSKGVVGCYLIVDLDFTHHFIRILI